MFRGKENPIPIGLALANPVFANLAPVRLAPAGMAPLAGATTFLHQLSDDENVGAAGSAHQFIAPMDENVGAAGSAHQFIAPVAGATPTEANSTDATPPQQQAPVSTSILGVRVDRLAQQQVLALIEQMIARRRASGNTLPCQQIVTVNTEFVVEAQHNPEFRRTINEAALVVPDGIGVVWGTHYIGTPAPERITGTDTLELLAKRCAPLGYRLYLLGAAPGVAEQAAAHLQALAPGLQIAGMYAGSPAPTEEEAILERIRAAQADVLCVAYGAPAQDLWIRRNLSRLPVAVAMGVGGAFDFLSGRQRRAPRLMQSLGLEWLYRLYREPWRWQRMLAIPRFLRLLLSKEYRKK
jgi:N-acetylglucosaminyldiphosphoundecaprenol N-acetyl-beta-D-mannosaminyltransferase